MNPFFIILIFVMTWWIVFMMALPFAVKPSENSGEGHAKSAPENPYLWQKAGITTVITIIITTLLCYILPK